MAAGAQIELIDAQPLPLRFEPEFELLLACCGSWKHGLASILASPLNWDRVLTLADNHRVMPALYASVGERSDLPASIRSAICFRFRAHARKVLCFSAELARIFRHFTNRDIPALAYKGPALAQLLYGDPAMRQFGDLDVLLRATDIPSARSALKELGYEPRIELSPRQEREYLRSGYEYVFGMNTERNWLELHWQIVPRFYSIDFRMESLFERSGEIDVAGSTLRTLGHEDLMLILCTHAAKHEWVQLGMLRDIAALARFDLDWEWIETEAQSLGIARIVAISLLLVCQLWGQEIPLRTCPDGATELADAIQLRLADCVQLEVESWRYFRTMMRVRERWQDRLRLLFRLAATPSISEWQAAKIPDSLFSLYRGVRLLRLARRLCS